MYEELQLLNSWILSKDLGFLRRLGIDRTYFFTLRDIVDWIEQYSVNTGKLPSLETTAIEFEDFRAVQELEPSEYIAEKLMEAKAYTEYRPALVKSAEIAGNGNTMEAIWEMKNSVDEIVKKYSGKITEYDWVKDAEERYEKYLEKHGKVGLAGLTTGIVGLDELTGGWKEDDLILISGRTNEGKSLVGAFFCYMAWQSLVLAGITKPVIYISTEMSELEISYRLDTLRQHFSNRALNEGKLSDPETYKEYLERLAKFDTSFIILSQESNKGKPFTPNDIRSIIDAKKPAFVCIDQLYDLSDGSGEKDIRKRLVNISGAIRDINLATKTPVMMIAQAGREAAKAAKKDKNATPELHEVQESDNPAQKATRVITIRLLDNKMFKLSVKKNRGGKKDEDIFMEANIDTGIWCETVQEVEGF